MAIETPQTMKDKKMSKSDKKKLEELVKRKAGLIEMIESFPKPKNVPEGDLVKLYFEEWGKKYGY
jgi:hypothetical protein